MSQGEFDIIARYFQRPFNANDGIVVGIGDDCAVLDIPDGFQLAVTTDSLVSGIHFFPDVDPYRLGYKALAVNLSDLAAMGAQAKWVSLAITLPDIDEQWLSEFCRGFFELADKYNVQLVGGDTTKGPLSITVSAKGLVKRGKALTRYNAKVGDLICVSGHLGNAALGLALKLNQEEVSQIPLNQQPIFIDALEITEPRLELASLLAEYATTSCIDLSDSLSQDLSHILKQSNCTAEIALQHLPLSDAMLSAVNLGHISQLQAWRYAVTGGDDYELLFTLPAEKLLDLQTHINSLPNTSSISCFVIGTMTASTLADDNSNSISFTHFKKPVELTSTGWDHFK
jgi:thiamine-monophosphate kinase